MRTNNKRFTVQRNPSANRELGLGKLGPNKAHDLDSLQESLLMKFEREYADINPIQLHHALNEANALASTTTVPQLFLPELAEEKIRSLKQWEQKQSEVLNFFITLAA